MPLLAEGVAKGVREAGGVCPVAGTVLVARAEDLQAAVEGMASSQEPFDRFFRDHLRDVHGLDLEDGFTPPEQVLDFRAAT